VSIDCSRDDDTFHVRIVGPAVTVLPPGGAELSGRWRVRDGLVVTAIVLPAGG